MSPTPDHSISSRSADDSLLSMKAICKSFGGVAVLKNVDFDVKAGEVHALCGENGAGKTTLMNLLAGVHQPDAGTMVLDGKTFAAFADAQAAQEAGVGMVFQERSLFGPLTVAENIFAGRQPVKRWGCIDQRRLRADAARWLALVAPDILPEATVSDLSPAQQQMVEIAKALSLQAKVMVFDEPTAALTAVETGRLFEVIRNLRSQKVGVVYISHRLEEVFALADRVTVLKDGVGQGTVAVAETSANDLIRRMVGRDVERAQAGASDPSAPVLLDVTGLSDPQSTRAGTSLLRDVSFYVRAGEIVGLAGLAGAGRTETALSLFGVRPRGFGQVRVSGRAAEIHSPTDAIAAGLGYVSEDRKESGLFLDMSLRRNISAAALRRFGGWFFRGKQEAQVATDYQQRLRITCRDADQDVGHLSGGNQQKALLARWLLVNPQVLIVDEPTRGVDVGAKVEVHRLLRDFTREGRAVLMISSDLPEVLTMSDRLYVMRSGQITGELSRKDMSEEAIMRLAAQRLTTDH